MADPQEEEAMRRLEAAWAETKLITVIKKGDEAPRVEWDKSLTEDEVIAHLVRAIMFMAVDEYLLDMLDEPDEEL